MGAVTFKRLAWYWREAKKRIRRNVGIIKFAVQMLMKPKHTVFTCKGEVVDRFEYIKGLLPYLK